MTRPKIGIVSWVDIRKEGHFKEYSALFVSSPTAFGLDNFPNLTVQGNLNLGNKLQILEKFIQSQRISHIFFEWGHDLVNDWRQIDLLLFRMDVTFSTIGSFTQLIDNKNRNPNDTPTFNAAKLWNMALSSKTCKGLISWDPRMVDLNPLKFPIAFLPDYQESRISIPDKPLISKNLSTNKTLGFFGQLFAYRGLEALIHIAKLNPGISIYAIGRIKYSNSKRSSKIAEKKMWKEFKGLKNVVCIDQYIENSQELNFYISKMDAIFLDTKNYTIPSGIVTRARNIGTSVLITSVNSAVAEIYLHDPNVITLDSFSGIESIIPSNRNQVRSTTEMEFRKTFFRIMSEFSIE